MGVARNVVGIQSRDTLEGTDQSIVNTRQNNQKPSIPEPF